MKTLKTFEGFKIGKKDDVRFTDAIEMSYNWNKQIKVDYEKIAKTIKSLDKFEQEETIKKMIDSFEKKFEKPLDNFDSKTLDKCDRELMKRVKELKDDLKHKIEELEIEITNAEIESGRSKSGKWGEPKN